MYQFVDTNGNSQLGVHSPSDNMKVNQNYLDRLIDGYRQLYVSGRSLIGQEIDYTKVPGRAGVVIMNIQDTHREIEVFYKLEAESSEALREKFAKLNSLLRGKLTVVFDDEPNYSYIAYLSDTGEVPEQALMVQSSFKLLVPNPYKLKDRQYSTGRIALLDAKQVLPSKIVLNVSRNTDTVEVVNGNKRMKLVGNFLQGQQIVFEWLEDKVTITYQNRSVLSTLAHLSAPEEFYIKNGDVVTAINASVGLVEWRDERL